LFYGASSFTLFVAIVVNNASLQPGSDAESAVVDGDRHSLTRFQVIFRLEIDQAVGVLETEAHDGFSLDGRVVDVDIGNVGKVDQRHDVAHAKHLVENELFQISGVVSQRGDGEIGESEHGQVEPTQLGQSCHHVIHALVRDSRVGDVEAVDILEFGEMFGADVSHFVVPILLHDQRLQRLDVTDPFHVVIRQSSVHRYIQMFQSREDILCLESVEELVREQAADESELLERRRESGDGDEGQVEVFEVKEGQIGEGRRQEGEERIRYRRRLQVLALNGESSEGI